MGEFVRFIPAIFGSHNWEFTTVAMHHQYEASIGFRLIFTFDYKTTFSIEPHIQPNNRFHIQPHIQLLI